MHYKVDDPCEGWQHGWNQEKAVLKFVRTVCIGTTTAASPVAERVHGTLLCSAAGSSFLEADQRPAVPPDAPSICSRGH